MGAALQDGRGKSVSLRDSLLALMIVVLWGFHTVVIRIGVLEIPPLLLLAIRMGGTALVFAPFAKKISMDQFKVIGIYSLFYIFLHIGLLAVGLYYLESATVALLLQTTIPFALIFGWLMHRETFGWKTTLGLVIAFLGVLLILYKPDADFSLMGALMILFSSACWGFGTVFVRKTKGIDLATLTAYAYALPFLPMLALSLWLEPGQFHTLLYESNLKVVALVCAYQILIMSLCHAWWRNLMVRNPVYLVTCFSLIQPLLTVLFGHWILDEDLGKMMMIGGAISLFGVAIVMLRRVQKHKA
jgi:O-acetylserine/cysteine efflux transporter